MPAPTTADEFLALVRKSGLADQERLEAALEHIRAAGPLPEKPKELAVHLVRHGVLTYFYAEQFLRGVWRGFTIGKYQILERLGSGGMGVVYLGEHKLMGHRVAIKVLPVALAENRYYLDRFYQEAQAAAGLNHPNIVRANDVDRDGKLHFLVMEYVDGSSLQDIVSRHGPMSIARAPHYVRQAALGLQQIHEGGLVHRDIKPANLLLSRQGLVKILDLGLVRCLNTAVNGDADTPKKTRVGTDDYLAPEQILNSEDVDIRADIYGLGATFYFMLTGMPPFEEAANSYQKLLRHCGQSPKPITTLRPEVPAALAAVVEKMMAKNAWLRYQTPAAVVDALAPWTQTAIAPPPEAEMPQLSPAVRRPRVVRAVAPLPAGSGASEGNSSVWHTGAEGSTVNSAFMAGSSRTPGSTASGAAGQPTGVMPREGTPPEAPAPVSPKGPAVP